MAKNVVNIDPDFINSSDDDDNNDPKKSNKRNSKSSSKSKKKSRRYCYIYDRNNSYISTRKLRLIIWNIILTLYIKHILKMRN